MTDAFQYFAGELRWVAWRNEIRKDKPTKVPYGARGRRAKANDRTTWISRAEAESRAKNLVNGQGGGIGIQLGELDETARSLAGADLDTCIAADGCLAPWAERIVGELPTYAEKSPSGTGLKAFFFIAAEHIRPFLDLIGAAADGWGIKRGIDGKDRREHAPGVEIYLKNRYFAVTGELYPGSPADVRPLDWDQLERLAKALPLKQTATGKGKGRDTSRSAAAWRLGAKMRREGKTFEEFVDAALADPDTAEWTRTKGVAEDSRELIRIWQRVDPAYQNELINELNKTYAVIRVVNRVAILNEHLDAEGHPSFSLLSVDSFKLWLANRSTTIVEGDANNVMVATTPVADLWIEHAKRRQYEGITFAPQGAPHGYFNLWAGLPIKRSSAGSCELFKEHLKYNVCDDNPELYNWTFGWFADIFQHPEQKCGTSLVLRGEMGVGKTIVGEVFGHLLGLHYVQVADPRYVTGRFNAHLVRCLLFHLDEGFWAGDRVAEGKLKDLVTGRRHPIELKGYEVFFVPNYVRVFINGNPDWLVPAGFAERRFATLDVADHHIQDKPYFRNIVAELKAGGYAKLLDELLNFDLTSVNLGQIPKTDALLDQKIAGASPEDAWWLDVLKRGRLPHHSVTATPGKCPGQCLYDDYIEHAKKQGAARRQIETAIGIFFKKTTPNITTKYDRFIIKDATNFEPDEKGRGAVYTFPPLGECRDDFVKKIHHSINWGRDAPSDWETES